MAAFNGGDAPAAFDDIFLTSYFSVTINLPFEKLEGKCFGESSLCSLCGPEANANSHWYEDMLCA